MRNVPVVLAIGGSDSSAGAGIQADIKTLSALGLYGLTAVTSVTTQTHRGVVRRDDLSPESVVAQIQAAFDTADCRAVKIGMLGSAQVAGAVFKALSSFRPPRVVVDPVMQAEAGGRLTDEGALEIFLTGLPVGLSVVTPNLGELVGLAGRPATSLTEVEAAAQALIDRGVPAVLTTGLDFIEGIVADYLVTNSGEKRLYSAPRMPHGAHGTGCTLSTALAGFLARGFSLDQAVEKARNFVYAAMKEAVFPRPGWPVANQSAITRNE